ncbi:MAG: IS1634 family transposase [Bacteroidetes bacterium]|nr:IS1634 family transposase [Bacteroidota bacterium]MBK8416199.1 IS1634 family transposase [Bacteroidota bacterium]MBK9047941.1 IS1634 family transposase [Bacteroidota bacterium]MBK9422755.1 IS1634 family transposase [Bacteroidota bacterium]MBL0071695.1 IS1634 family transposase [Bacteroidota bacterium]
MFIRQKRNISGKVSVQIIDKSSGRYKVVHTLGCTSSKIEIQELLIKARQWMVDHCGQINFDFDGEKLNAEKLLDSITAHKQVGLELTIGKVFDSIGFGVIEDEIFKWLVLYRLIYPKSKLKTTEYLHRYHGIDYDENQIYRYLDKLNTEQKEIVQQISFEHTKQILDGEISIVFYDVTTIYFEIEKEDELRRTGFSKEGKHQNPQIVLGLLVASNGYPLAYEIFNGSQFEGHTMLPVLESFKRKYQLERLVVVADSGLLSKPNVKLLKEQNYEFIIGARIKAESSSIKKKILDLRLSNLETAIIKKEDLKLIVSYSEKRAKKDCHNRERGIARLEKQITTGKLKKAHINNKGYNKYLKIDNEIMVHIDYNKFYEDAKWDGLKGYLTNSPLKTNAIIENYSHLWQIETAFRVSKTDLKVRPIYHRLQKRIEAHICLNFVAYKVYKELERILKQKKSALTPTKVIEIAANLFEIEVKLPGSKESIKKKLILTEEHREIANLFDF